MVHHAGEFIFAAGLLTVASGANRVYSLSSTASSCPSWCATWRCDGSSWCAAGALPDVCGGCARTGKYGGGQCSCPDGQVYWVSAREPRCRSLACDGGWQSECKTSWTFSGQHYHASTWAGRAVECEAPSVSPPPPPSACDDTVAYAFLTRDGLPLWEVWRHYLDGCPAGSAVAIAHSQGTTARRDSLLEQLRPYSGALVPPDQTLRGNLRFRFDMVRSMLRLFGLANRTTAPNGCVPRWVLLVSERGAPVQPCAAVHANLSRARGVSRLGREGRGQGWNTLYVRTPETLPLRFQPLVYTSQWVQLWLPHAAVLAASEASLAAKWIPPLTWDDVYPTVVIGDRWLPAALDEWVWANELAQHGFPYTFGGMMRVAWGGSADHLDTSDETSPAAYLDGASAAAACLSARAAGYAFARKFGADAAVVASLKACLDGRDRCWSACATELHGGGDCSSFCGAGRSCCEHSHVDVAGSSVCHEGSVGCHGYHCCTDNEPGPPPPSLPLPMAPPPPLAPSPPLRPPRLPQTPPPPPAHTPPPPPHTPPPQLPSPHSPPPYPPLLPQPLLPPPPPSSPPFSPPSSPPSSPPPPRLPSPPSSPPPSKPPPPPAPPLSPTTPPVPPALPSPPHWPPPPPLDCWHACGDVGGACPSVCGREGACCRQRYQLNNPECGFGTHGCEWEHCCVPAVGIPSPPRPPLLPPPPPPPPMSSPAPALLSSPRPPPPPAPSLPPATHIPADNQEGNHPLQAGALGAWQEAPPSAADGFDATSTLLAVLPLAVLVLSLSALTLLAAVMLLRCLCALRTWVRRPWQAPPPSGVASPASTTHQVPQQASRLARAAAPMTASCVANYRKPRDFVTLAGEMAQEEVVEMEVRAEMEPRAEVVAGAEEARAAAQVEEWPPDSRAAPPHPAAEVEPAAGGPEKADGESDASDASDESPRRANRKLGTRTLRLGRERKNRFTRLQKADPADIL